MQSLKVQRWTNRGAGFARMHERLWRQCHQVENGSSRSSTVGRAMGRPVADRDAESREFIIQNLKLPSQFSKGHLCRCRFQSTVGCRTRPATGRRFPNLACHVGTAFGVVTALTAIIWTRSWSRSEVV
jgi:hypothetical protein